MLDSVVALLGEEDAGTLQVWGSVGECGINGGTARREGAAMKLQRACSLWRKEEVFWRVSVWMMPPEHP